MPVVVLCMVSCFGIGYWSFPAIYLHYRLSVWYIETAQSSLCLCTPTVHRVAVNASARLALVYSPTQILAYSLAPTQGKNTSASSLRLPAFPHTRCNSIENGATQDSALHEPRGRCQSQRLQRL